VNRQARFFGFGLCALLVVAGGLCAALVSGTLGQVLAFVLIALALVGVTSLVFLEVGLSEDRQRARDEAAAVPRREETAGGRGESDRPSARRRLGRMRGRSRRLGQ
jgi:hypothetical protein